MAAFGATGADFGNTRKSATFSRTRLMETDTGTHDNLHSVTPGAAAALALLRSELLPIKKPGEAQVAAAKPDPKGARPPSMQTPSAAPPSAGVSGHSGSHKGSKQFLSKAERRKEKKARQSKTEETLPGVSVCSASGGHAGGVSKTHGVQKHRGGITKSKKKKRKRAVDGAVDDE
eukprot:CAMPEP_0174736352 /NCGR_PEP_ID=MMETSP1094-20130205/66530_1 /TAXON_ID=156173 /ORGANISM="Chrysochromulina brevifilum, Strain UTEX LB 985" /LENGTH=174 /DNA_ID=CAMNT_0015939433 /DNA_START=109 /DNA_END=633 /DNA_ORIENTATION=+